jgi:nucleotide-binding universal stress UspA family protein
LDAEKEDIMNQKSHFDHREMEGCVMLALSSFRRSQEAVEVAIEMGRAVNKLMVVYVVDINTARYLQHVEEEFFLGLKESCESELLENATQEGHKHVATIAEEAGKKGIEVKTLVQLGRFAVVCLDVANQTNPYKIVTTRSQRPKWIKKFYGAPVDDLIAKAECPVLAI